MYSTKFAIRKYYKTILFSISVIIFLFFQRWTAKPGESFFLYRATSVLFQLFCDHTLLEKFPRKAFLPWDSVKEMKDKTKDKYPVSYMIKKSDYLLILAWLVSILGLLLFSSSYLRG